MDEAKKKTNQAVTPGPALTRREWLLSLGSAVVLSGFRGVPEEAAQEIILHLEQQGFIGVSPEPVLSTGA